jgi:Ca-activated chloride channel family protein
MRPTVRLEHELLTVQQQHRVAAMLELHAPPAPVAERPPLNLALVVDESGSMSGEKIATVRRCARFLVERLRPTDRLAIVGFDTSVRLHTGLGVVRRDAALAAVDHLRAGSMTNLSGGWLKGVEELGRLETADPRKVLLLSDGHANQGVTDRDRLATMVVGAVGKGIGTTTIGFGDGFDEDLMTGMADAGCGTAHYAATIEDAPEIFAAEFDDLASTVAHNVSVEIRPTDDVKLLGVLNDYPTTEVIGGIHVQLGDTFGDEVRRLVFELHIPHLADLGERRVADVITRYATIGDRAELREVTIPIMVNAVDEAAASGAPVDRGVTEQVTTLRAAVSRRRAQRLADEGHFAEAETELASSLGALQAAAAVSPAPDGLLADVRQLEYNRQSMRERRWSAVDRKRMHYEAHHTSKSRRRVEREQPHQPEER